MKQIRADIQSSLAENNFETPGNISLLLLSHVLGKTKTWVLTHPEIQPSPDETKALQKALDQLLQGVPLPHILGEWAFYGRSFIVSPDVLIPRPETELLIERALSLAAGMDQPHVVDVGTGSGAIAISLAAALPLATVLAIDISRSALHIARQNAQKHLSKTMPIVQGNLLQPLSGPFNLICANLPYIPSRTLEGLPVARWEPTLALNGGPTGLDLIEKLLHQAVTRLSPTGSILLEIESSLGQKTLLLAKSIFPTAEINLHQDLSGKDRLVEIQIP